MNKRNYSKDWSSLALMISFNELAWICFLAATLLYAAAKLKNLKNQDLVSKASAGLIQASNMLAEAKSLSMRNEEFSLLFSTNRNERQKFEMLSKQYETLQNDKAKDAVLLKLAISEINEKADSEKKVRAELDAAQKGLDRLRSQLAALPPNFAKIDQELRLEQARSAEFQKQLNNTTTAVGILSNQLRLREVGEFSVRRELTGLPDRDLKRVIFIVDTSSSMRNSPAWNSAKKLVSTWLEFLPVEECVLVNFNDVAVGFPKHGYHRVRNPDGTNLADRREELLRAFDQAPTGTFTDLLSGLRRAYEYPTADVMVLFTDGHPHVATQGDASLASAIFREVAKHRDIPILAVALGSYEIEGAGNPKPRTNAPVNFLKELARKTGGNFLAR